MNPYIRSIGDVLLMGMLSYNERQGRPFLRAVGKVLAGGLMQRGERVGDKRRKGPALRTDPFA